MEVITQYIIIPDTEKKGTGITAGGALLTLLGAVYLSPLDRAMNRLYKKRDLFYIRYQDDCGYSGKDKMEAQKGCQTVISGPGKTQTQDTYRRQIFCRQNIKMFLFFRGYFFMPREKLIPSEESQKRFVQHTRRLIEQGAPTERLLSYVECWTSSVRAGLGYAVSSIRLGAFLKFFECYNIILSSTNFEAKNLQYTHFL